MPQPLFSAYQFGAAEKAQLDRDGHFVFLGLLNEETQEKLIESLAKIDEFPVQPERIPRRFSAEYDAFLASIIGHPQMVELARSVLGEEIRYDHCVDLSREGSDPGQGWHTHSYANDQPELGFIRIFFYVNGFKKGDGNLKVVPGSHLLRESLGNCSDEVLEEWLKERPHPVTGEKLEMEEFDIPAGSVIVMWTHALHAVSPRLADSPTRWAVVYAYRNPGAASHARWIGADFEANPPEGAEGLMGLY